MLCLNLERTPAAEIIPGTVEAWLEVAADRRAWDEARDIPRIRQAFLTLARTRRTWPAPVDFFEALPPFRSELVALPKKAADPERVKAVMDEMGKTLGVR